MSPVHLPSTWAYCTNSEKSYVSATDSTTFSSASLSQSPATNFTGYPREGDRRSFTKSTDFTRRASSGIQ